MKNLKKSVLAVARAARAIIARVRAVAGKNPARCISLATSAIVFVAAKLGVIVPEQSIIHAVEFVLPLLLSGELTHHNVSPAK